MFCLSRMHIHSLDHLSSSSLILLLLCVSLKSHEKTMTASTNYLCVHIYTNVVVTETANRMRMYVNLISI